jgi:CRISPR system Cascade subunit CasE
VIEDPPRRPSWYLTRARLRRDASVAALAHVLLPDDEGARAAAGHSLIWSLFAGNPEGKRDFLYREEGRARTGRFIILSPRPPEDRVGLFEMEEPKEFAPALSVGDKLAFALRANPTIERKAPDGSRSLRSDVMMHRLSTVSKGERAQLRDAIAREAALAWLEAQARRSGFALTAVDEAFRVEGHDQVTLPRRGGRAIRFSRIDIEGLLSVTDPAAFIAKLAGGFGRAKAFGCGLMLIRRASR